MKPYYYMYTCTVTIVTGCVLRNKNLIRLNRNCMFVGMPRSASCQFRGVKVLVDDSDCQQDIYQVPLPMTGERENGEGARKREPI